MHSWSWPVLVKSKMTKKITLHFNLLLYTYKYQTAKLNKKKTLFMQKNHYFRHQN